MTTTKTLMLAALAALSLGTATAMAQEGGGPSMAMPNDYWSVQQRALYAHQAPADGANTVQSGESDTDTTRALGTSGWTGDKSPFRFNYGTLANPG
jgi:hypothetical protein